MNGSVAVNFREGISRVVNESSAALEARRCLAAGRIRGRKRDRRTRQLRLASERGRERELTDSNTGGLGSSPSFARRDHASSQQQSAVRSRPATVAALSRHFSRRAALLARCSGVSCVKGGTRPNDGARRRAAAGDARAAGVRGLGRRPELRRRDGGAQVQPRGGDRRAGVVPPDQAQAAGAGLRRGRIPVREDDGEAPDEPHRPGVAQDRGVRGPAGAPKRAAARRRARQGARARDAREEHARPVEVPRAGGELLPELPALRQVARPLRAVHPRGLCAQRRQLEPERAAGRAEHDQSAGRAAQLGSGRLSSQHPHAPRQEHEGPVVNMAPKLPMSLVPLTLLVVSVTCKRPSIEFSAVDMLRKTVMQLEDQQEFPRSMVTSADRSMDQEYIAAIYQYKRLGDRIEREFTTDYEQYVELLNTLWLWARTQSELRTIEGIYLTFRRMQKDLAERREPLDTKMWANFARTVLTDVHASIPAALERIADFIVNQRLFVSAYQEASTQICNNQQSPQQLLYNLYNTIALTEIKGYTMMQFSWTILKLYNIGNFTEEMEQLKQQYAIRTSETLRAVKTAMVFAPREVWKCDPAKHKPEVTYSELKQVFQGYIVNEVDMNPQSTCKENCAYYSYSKVYGCYQNQFCATQKRCNGKLINCQYIDSDMWVCPSERSSTRRYEYIEYENGQTFGPKATCRRGTTKVNSWWRWLFWHCSYCMCFCDDHNSNSDRYFNLRDVTSDVDDNKVVTGVQMKKVNQIIHIQIQQGKLLPRGGIDGESVGWKKVDNYTIVDPSVRAGVDYHTIMWEKRAVDLDDLDSPADHLLTGLRFRVIGAHLNLEIRMTPFNFTTGELAKDRSVWHSYDTTDASEVYDLDGETRVAKKRTEVKLNKPDVSTRSVAQALPDSHTNQYVMFGPTDLQKDAGQSTIPFIDTQRVEPNPPTPISGAGIFHKGRDGYGGFLALKLITYNFEPQLRAELPSTPPVIAMSNDVNAM